MIVSFSQHRERQDAGPFRGQKLAQDHTAKKRRAEERGQICLDSKVHALSTPRCSQTSRGSAFQRLVWSFIFSDNLNLSFLHQLNIIQYLRISFSRSPTGPPLISETAGDSGKGETTWAPSALPDVLTGPFPMDCVC